MRFTRALTCPVVIGRDAELAELSGLVDTTAQGRGGLVLITGEPGIGKSRLADEAAVIAANAGFVVVRGAAYPGDRAIPWSPLVDAFSSVAAAAPLRDLLVGAVHEVSPDAGGAPSPAAHRITLEKVFDQFVRLARVRPMLLLLDDLHWADLTTLAFLQLIAPRLRTAPALILCTARDSELDGGAEFQTWFTEIDRRRQLTVVPLAPLGDDDVAKMVTATLERPGPGTLGQQVVERAGGIPFYVEELLRAVATQEVGTDLRLPSRLRDVLLERLRPMSDAAHRAGGAAAIIGRRFDARVVSEVLHVGPVESQRLFEELLAWQVIEETGEAAAPYRFRHALLRQAFEERIRPAERRDLHLRVAETLAATAGAEGNGVEAGLVARHWLAGGDHDRAREAFLAAGLAAMAVSGFGEAQTHLELALALTPAEPSEERGRLLLHLGRSAAAMTRISVAIGHFDEASRVGAEIGSHRLEGEALRLLGRQYSVTGRATDAIPYLTRAVELLDAFPEHQGWAEAYLGQALAIGEREAEAEHWAGLALNRAEESGNRGLRASALNTLGICTRRSSDYVGGLQYIGSAIVEAEAAGIAEEIDRAHNNYVHFLRYLEAPVGQWLPALDRALETMDRIGTPRGGSYTAASMIATLIHFGMWDRAAALLTRVEEYTFDAYYTARAHIEFDHGLFGYYRGDWHAAERRFTAGLAALGEDAALDGVTPNVAYLAHVRRLQRDRAHGPGLVAAWLDRAMSRQSPVHVPALARALALQWIETGDYEAVRGIMDILEGVPPASAPFQRDFALATVAGAVAIATGDAQAGKAHYVAAADSAEELGRPILAGEALTEAGAALLRRRGHVERAFGERLLDRARAIFEPLGSPFVERYLEASGASRAASPTIAPEIRALSAREREVFALLGRGISNRQIAEELVLSERTVERHLLNIYAKLAIESRSTAIALAARLGIGNS